MWAIRLCQQDRQNLWHVLPASVIHSEPWLSIIIIISIIQYPSLLMSSILDTYMKTIIIHRYYQLWSSMMCSFPRQRLRDFENPSRSSKSSTPSPQVAKRHQNLLTWHSSYPLVNSRLTMENHHRNSDFPMKNGGSVHSYVYKRLPEGAWDSMYWFLVGGCGWPTPLKNDGLRQLGSWNSNWMEK